jgi:hypothetical protein
VGISQVAQTFESWEMTCTPNFNVMQWVAAEASL